MKKLIFTALSCFSVFFYGNAIDWNKENNITQNEGVEVIASSVREGQPRQLIDLNLGGDGCSTRKMGYSTHTISTEGERDYTVSQNWFIIDLGNSHKFTTFEIYWRNNHASKYDIYVSETPFEYNKVNDLTPDPQSSSDILNDLTTDLDGLNPVYSGSNDREDAFSEEVHLAKAAKGRYILINCEPNNTAKDWGVGILEIFIGDFEGAESVSSISIPNLNCVINTNSTVSVTLYDGFGNVVEDYDDVDLSLTCSDPEAVEIEETETAGTFTLIANKLGEYTLNAVATLEDGTQLTAESTIKVTVNWEETDNIINSGMTVYGRMNPDFDIDVNIPSNAIDGDEDTYYAYNGNWGGSESWLFIDLGKEYIISNVEALMGEKSKGTYKLGYAADGEDVIVPSENLNQNWQSDSKFSGWNSTETLNRDSNGIAAYSFENPVLARYIAFRDISNPDQAIPQYKEIFVDGKERSDESVAQYITVEANEYYVAANETVTITAHVFDQDKVEMNIEEGIEFWCNGNRLANDETNNNVCKVDFSKIGGVGDWTITVKYEKLDEAECIVHVLGGSDNNLSPEEKEIEHEIIIDGVKSDRTLGSIAPGKELNVEENKIVEINFKQKTYDFDYIKITWEGACPADYSVTAVYYDYSEGEIFSITGRQAVANLQRVDKIYIPKTEKLNVKRRADDTSTSLTGIQAIKINATKAANSGWGMKLQGVELYGTKSDAIVTGIENTLDNINVEMNDIYTMMGVKVASNVNFEEVKNTLAPGLYIVGNKKVLVK